MVSRRFLALNIAILSMIPILIACSAPEKGTTTHTEAQPIIVANSENLTDEQPDIPVNSNFKEDFVLPYSSKKKLTDDEILNLLPENMSIARNEIAARNGYMFKTPSLKAYFMKKSWYKPNETFNPESLTPIEKYNMSFIKYQENTNLPVKVTDSIYQKPDIYDSDKEIQVDLNGDNLPENIIYRHTESHFIIKVNDQTFEGDGDFFAEKFAIVDINTKDTYKELIISDYGPSDDLISTYFAYDGNRLSRLGQTGGAYDGGIQITGNRQFTALMRADILHTWYMNKPYELTIDHKLREVDTNYYKPNLACHVFVKEPVQVFSEKNYSRPAFLLQEGTTITLTGTDNVEWIEIKTENNEKGWIGIKNFDHLSHENRPASEAFFGLCYAD